MGKLLTAINAFYVVYTGKTHVFQSERYNSFKGKRSDATRGVVHLNFLFLKMEKIGTYMFWENKQLAKK